jgi:DNA-damage-inducible protein J
MPSSRSPSARLRCLLFKAKMPNATTRPAMAELEQGKGKRFDSADALLEDLDI